MFMQWWAFENVSVHRDQMLSEDKPYSLHITHHCINILLAAGALLHSFDFTCSQNFEAL
jgi:hypothetical protein